MCSATRVTYTRLEYILSRCRKSCLQGEEGITQEGASEDMEPNNPCTRFRTCNELLQSVRRVNEEGNEVSVSDLTELEEELNDALMHARARKTQLLMEHISTFHEQLIKRQSWGQAIFDIQAPGLAFPA
ncbi:hypothetical protein L1887_33043 [Cichorium endivia]|nr:hypothetical protein L1887_33043 [Cichorium endivia]